MKFRIALTCAKTGIIFAYITVTGVGDGKNQISFDFMKGKINSGIRQGSAGFYGVIAQVRDQGIQV